MTEQPYVLPAESYRRIAGDTQRSAIAAAALVLALSASASAEWLVFNGGRVEKIAGPWQEKGRAIYFTTTGGTYSIAKADDVDLPASRFLSAQMDPGYKVVGRTPQEGDVALLAPEGCASSGVVREVVDGDTLKVELAGRLETVRLACVDTPETKHPNKPVEFFGAEASRFTTTFARGKTVCLAPDPAQPARDRYGRLLSYVTLPDGHDLGALLVRGGFGQVYRSGPCARREPYEGLETAAALERAGLWGGVRFPQRDQFAGGIIEAGIAGDGAPGGEDGADGGKSVHVDAYTRSDGTYVQEHYRAAPGTKPP